MKSYQRGFGLIAACAAAIALAGCAGGGSSEDAAADCVPQHEFSTLTEGELTVAVVPLPNVIDIADGSLNGVEGEILEGFAAAECLTISPEEIGGAGIIPAVQAERVDIATGGWGPLPERLELVGFSGVTYVDPVVVLSKEGYGSIQELEDAGVTVASPQGNWWVEDVQEVLGSQQKIYQSFDEAFKDLVSGRVDAMLSTVAVSLSFMQSSDSEGFEEVIMDSDDRIEQPEGTGVAAFPLTKGNDELKSAIDAYIEEIRADGTLVEILETYGLPATSAELP